MYTKFMIFFDIYVQRIKFYKTKKYNKNIEKNGYVVNCLWNIMDLQMTALR